MVTELTDPTFQDIADLATKINAEEGTTPSPEPKAPRTKPDAKEKPKEAAPETAREPQQEEVDDEPLPEGVRKRIEQETKKAARIQAEIDKAVSNRKAKEAELASLKGKQGSEPEKQTAPKKDERPTPPDLATFPGTLAEFNEAQRKYMADMEKYLEGQTRATVQKEFDERNARESRERAWKESEAVLVKAGTLKAGEFAPLMDALAQELPIDLQRAVSALDDWATVAVHLAQNDDVRAELIESFKADRLRTIAKLGKLEDKLSPAAKTAKPDEDEEEETLPPPARAIGGAARGAVKTKPLHEMVAKNGDVGDFLNEVGRQLKAS